MTPADIDRLEADRQAKRIECVDRLVRILVKEFSANELKFVQYCGGRTGRSYRPRGIRASTREGKGVIAVGDSKGSKNPPGHKSAPGGDTVKLPPKPRK